MANAENVATMPVTITDWITRDESHRVSDAEQDALTEETHALLKTHFAPEIGAVPRVNLMPCATRLQLPAGQETMFIGMNRFPHCVRQATLDKCEWYTQRGHACLIKFNFPDGPRMIVVHTTEELTIRVAMTEGIGTGIMISSYPRDQPLTFLLNISVVDAYRCFRCEATSGHLLICERCRAVGTYTRYCSRECQVANWPLHKGVCGK